ncbi:MAG: hypothetical protein AAF501_02140 [Pseudomonadota bacterium]
MEYLIILIDSTKNIVFGKIFGGSYCYIVKESTVESAAKEDNFSVIMGLIWLQGIFIKYDDDKNLVVSAKGMKILNWAQHAAHAVRINQAMSARAQ